MNYRTPTTKSQSIRKKKSKKPINNYSTYPIRPDSQSSDLLPWKKHSPERILRTNFNKRQEHRELDFGFGDSRMIPKMEENYNTSKMWDNYNSNEYEYSSEDSNVSEESEGIYLPNVHANRKIYQTQQMMKNPKQMEQIQRLKMIKHKRKNSNVENKFVESKINHHHQEEEQNFVNEEQKIYTLRAKKLDPFDDSRIQPPSPEKSFAFGRPPTRNNTLIDPSTIILEDNFKPPPLFGDEERPFLKAASQHLKEEKKKRMDPHLLFTSSSPPNANVFYRKNRDRPDYLDPNVGPAMYFQNRSDVSSEGSVRSNRPNTYTSTYSYAQHFDDSPPAPPPIPTIMRPVSGNTSTRFRREMENYFAQQYSTRTPNIVRSSGSRPRVTEQILLKNLDCNISAFNRSVRNINRNMNANVNRRPNTEQLLRNSHNEQFSQFTIKQPQNVNLHNRRYSLPHKERNKRHSSASRTRRSSVKA